MQSGVGIINAHREDKGKSRVAIPRTPDFKIGSHRRARLVGARTVGVFTPMFALPILGSLGSNIKIGVRGRSSPPALFRRHMGV